MYSPVTGNTALAQSGSLTGQSYTAVPRVADNRWAPARLNGFGNSDGTGKVTINGNGLNNDLPKSA